jgi:Transposase DDE domain group 1
MRTPTTRSDSLRTPTFRMLASRERRDTSVALTSTLHWFETDVLAEEPNYQGLTRLNADLIQHAAARSNSRRVTRDIDSSQSPLHGTQEQSAYNGHFESVCYHPLFVFNPEGDCLTAKLRPQGTFTVRMGGRSCCPSMIFTLQLAESYLTGPLFRQIFARIERLAWHPT